MLTTYRIVATLSIATLKKSVRVALRNLSHTCTAPLASTFVPRHITRFRATSDTSPRVLFSGSEMQSQKSCLLSDAHLSQGLVYHSTIRRAQRPLVQPSVTILLSKKFFIYWLACTATGLEKFFNKIGSKALLRTAHCYALCASSTFAIVAAFFR